MIEAEPYEELLWTEEIAHRLLMEAESQPWTVRSRAYAERLREHWAAASDELERRRAMIDATRQIGVGGVG
ncbi:MAG: hypothetical protein WKF94_12940 [Solirubrobacteraceae bacterium]